jgi:hypothetical protein
MDELSRLARLRHDLGKYVALQTRGLPPDPTDDELREALAADLLRTRSGPDGARDALEVWEDVKVDLGGDPHFDRLLAAIERLRPRIAALRTGSLDRAGLLDAADAAREASDAAVALHRSRRIPPPE